jgi:hypothetical protein
MSRRASGSLAKRVVIESTCPKLFRIVRSASILYLFGIFLLIQVKNYKESNPSPMHHKESQIKNNKIIIYFKKSLK